MSIRFILWVAKGPDERISCTSFGNIPCGKRLHALDLDLYVLQMLQV
jgi:hypothetical protein